MNYWQKFRDNINYSVVISTMLGAALLGVVAYAAKQLKIKPVTEAANVATKGSKK